MIMSEYEFTIVHRKGSSHINADTLSRMPRDSDVDVTGARLDVDAAASSCDGTASSSSQLEPPAKLAAQAEVLCHWISTEPCEFNAIDGEVTSRAPGVTPLSCCATARDFHVLQSAAAAALSLQMLYHVQAVMPASAMSAIPDSSALLCGDAGPIVCNRSVATTAAAEATSIENTYMAFDFGKVARTMPNNIDVICNSIGSPVACDAAQFDSYAHRMRHYWTNLAHVEHLQVLLNHVERSPGLLVSDVLLPHRICLPVETAYRKPFLQMQR
eukprot:gene15319-biopygen6173